MRYGEVRESHDIMWIGMVNDGLPGYRWHNRDLFVLEIDVGARKLAGVVTRL